MRGRGRDCGSGSEPDPAGGEEVAGRAFPGGDRPRRPGLAVGEGALLACGADGLGEGEFVGEAQWGGEGGPFAVDV